MAALVATPLDFKEVNSLTDATVMDFERKLREEIKVFFIEEEINDVLDAMNNKKEERERSMKVLQSINLATKPEDELIELMTHIEEVMRIRALDIIYDKARNTSIPKQQQMETIARIRAHPKCLVAALNTRDIKALHKVIILLITVNSEEFKITFQHAGGLEAISNVLSFPLLKEEPDITARLMVVIINMVTCEDNKDPFRQANGIERLLPYISQSNPKICLMATEALLNLVLNSEPNQTLLSQSGAIPTIVKNAFSTSEYQTKYENTLLLRHIARSSSAKEVISPEDQRKLMSLLDPQKAYCDQDSIEVKQNIAIQKTILELLFELTQIERNQKILGECGLVEAMQSFFLPMRAQSGVKWNFEVLLRVLKITDNLVKFPANREQFLEKKSIGLVDQLIVNHGSYPEDCLMEAASILTTIATNAAANQQAFGKLGLQRLIGLWKQFPTRELMHDLVANMISNVATNARNRAIVMGENGDKILMTFVKESRVKQVLVKSCLGLAHLCGEVRIVRAIVSEKVVPYLVGLLQLNQPELQLNVVKILKSVAEASESGLIEIVRNGGIIPLIALLSDKNWEVRSQALGTLKKILFAPGNSGPQNIQLFFQAEGEKPLVKQCLLSPSESVHQATLEIIFGLMKTSPETRATLLEAGLEASLQQSIEECIVAGSKAHEIAKIIAGHIGSDAGAGAKGAVMGTRVRALWLKVVCGTQAKLFPLRDSLKFAEFVTAIRNEFKIREWDRLTFRHYDDEIEVTDQRSLNYILSCLQREIPIYVEILTKGNERANKLDLLLQRLTHRQLRVLLKEAIDKEADLSAAIRQCIIEDRKRKDATQAVPERVNIEPLGAPAEGETKPAPELSHKPVEAVTTAEPMKRGGPPPPSGPGGAGMTRGGGPPPPPPGGGPAAPKANATTNRLKVAKANASKGGNLMDQLKNAVAVGGGLRRVQLDEDAKKKYLNEDLLAKKGGSSIAVLGEGCTPGAKLWESDKQLFASQLQQVLLLDYGMMQVIFKVLQKTGMKYDILFQLIRDQSKITQDKLAQALGSVGIYVKFALLVITTGEGTEQENKSNQRKEYLCAIAPYDIPIGIMYKVIYRVLKTNGDKRIGGALAKDVDELAVLRAEEVKRAAQQAQAEVPTYGGRKNNRPVVVGSLWDNEEPAASPAPQPTPAAQQPVIAGWSKQKKPEVGKLW